MADEGPSAELKAKVKDLLCSKGPPDGPLKESDLKIVLACVDILARQQLDEAELLEGCSVQELIDIKIPLGAVKRLKAAFPGVDDKTSLEDLIKSQGPPLGTVLDKKELQLALKGLDILVQARLVTEELLKGCTESDLRGLEIPLGVARSLKKAFPGPSSSAAASVVPPAAGAAGSSAAAAAAAGTNNSGPPYPFKLVVKQRLPWWDVSATSSGTRSSRQLPRQRRFVPWKIHAERNEIMDFVQQECGDHTYDKPLYTDVLLKQIAEGEWELKNKAINPRLLAYEGDKTEKKASKRQQHMPPPQTRSKRASGGNTQQTCSQKPKRSKRGCQLEVTRNVLGRGQTGDVLAGRVHNKEVAVKSADLYKQTALVELLQHEVVVLKHLAPLQRPTGIVPELVEEGFIEGMDVFCIATGIVSGEHPSSSLRAAFPAAQEAVTAIHSKGVLHGDIRGDNVLVLKVEDAWKVCFIDFGQSTFSSDPALQAAEMKELQLLFRHSEDGNTNR